MIELGSFLIFNLMAFGFLAIGFMKTMPMSGVLQIVSFMFFLGLGFYMMIEDDIGVTDIHIDKNGKESQTVRIFMADRETDLMIWIYLGLAVFAFFMTFQLRGAIKV